MKKIDITKLTLKKVGRHYDGTSINIIGQVFFEGETIAEIQHNFRTDEFYGWITVFRKQSDKFELKFLKTSVTQIPKYGNKPHLETESIADEVRELKFSEIKTKIPSINELIDFFNTSV